MHAQTTMTFFTMVTPEFLQSPQAVFISSGMVQHCYDGLWTVKELLEYGDCGLGTFHRLDGELIVLDGVVYQVKGDGSVAQAAGDVTIPFAAVAHFSGGNVLPVCWNIPDLPSLCQWLDQQAERVGGHGSSMLLAKLLGRFDRICVRSVYPQQKPYPTLEQVSSEQMEYCYTHLTGTLVALKGPEEYRNINPPGWHFHFLSQDRIKGGHVLEAAIENIQGAMDIVGSVEARYPENRRIDTENWYS